MPLPTGDTIGILADNLRLRKSVLPIPAGVATRWSRGLNLPRGGETVLYTGMMYQLIPYIAAMSKAQGKVEDSPLANFVRLGRMINKVVNISGFMARPAGDMQVRYDGMLVGIARLLEQAGVEFGYLYEEELYSGALVYDLGVDDVFAQHAREVYQTFRKNGVKNVITVDPHTTNMLRSVYPQLIEGYNLKVRSYLEVLAERLPATGQAPGGADVVIHDSCVYARYENIIEPQRKLLAAAGISVKEPRDSGKFTLCCGGPAESLFPKKALERAAIRVAQLQAVSRQGVTMCPICLVNLQKAAGPDMNLRDISEYLTQGVRL